jgi:hypothetical protein
MEYHTRLLLNGIIAGSIYVNFSGIGKKRRINLAFFEQQIKKRQLILYSSIRFIDLTNILITHIFLMGYEFIFQVPSFIGIEQKRDAQEKLQTAQYADPHSRFPTHPYSRLVYQME